jgi:hypothetical protein
MACAPYDGQTGEGCVHWQEGQPSREACRACPWAFYCEGCELLESCDIATKPKIMHANQRALRTYRATKMMGIPYRAGGLQDQPHKIVQQLLLIDSETQKWETERIKDIGKHGR